ncbi:MAG: prolipoprotein diacylglyceryl transferase [Oscillospiraceae bacterium]|nr:prolipoprotein diacylglyceryl transferase [Oscillospiraceae bacterium]
MEKIGFISGGVYIYWSSVIIGLAVLTAIAAFMALYLKKSGNVVGACLTVPLCIITSLVLGRLVHWYCRADSYAGFRAAMTDYSWGGYALMGIFGACILCACLLRLLKVVKNLPELLDCMALSGGAGIAVGRLASFYNTSDRGFLMDESVGLPFAYPVTNPVSGLVETRLATFLLQSIVTAAIVLVLLACVVIAGARKKPIPDGDVCLLFLSAYGGSQVVFDSTRYDSLFLRSNGFISVVQILGAVALVLAVVLFSVRMVKNRGLKIYQFPIWLVLLGLLGTVGYLEYYVQRHGDQAVFAHSIMSGCIAAVVLLTVLIRGLAVPKQRTPVETE